MKNHNQFKLFKITHLNLKGKVRDWYKRIDLVFFNWATLKHTTEQKYGVVDLEEIKIRLETNKKKPNQGVQLYYDKLEKLFTRRKIKAMEQQQRFLSKLKLEIKKLCVVRDYVKWNLCWLLYRKMFGELGEIPYEPLKEEQDQFMNGRGLVVEKQVQVLNESLISLQRRQVDLQLKVDAPMARFTNFNVRQMCCTQDHVASDCLKYVATRPNCQKCGGYIK